MYAQGILLFHFLQRLARLEPMFQSGPIIDVNISLGRWPMRRAPLDELQKLRRKLDEYHVVEAWAGSFDGLIHRDLTTVNNRLAAECGTPAGTPRTADEPDFDRSPVRLVPFGEINPLLPDWRHELDRCAEHHGMPGVRLHPNYHGYTLDHPQFADLLKAAAERNLIVQLAVRMEDERMMHPLLRVPPVDLAPLASLMPQAPGLRLVLLNATKRPIDDGLSELMASNNVYCEIATLEGVDAIAQMLVDIRPARLLFGSHAPSLYFESAVMKLKESALPSSQLAAICHENARPLLNT